MHGTPSSMILNTVYTGKEDALIDTDLCYTIKFFRTMVNGVKRTASHFWGYSDLLTNLCCYGRHCMQFTVVGCTVGGIKMVMFPSCTVLFEQKCVPVPFNKNRNGKGGRAHDKWCDQLRES
jgi:hypothetical protein